MKHYGVDEIMGTLTRLARLMHFILLLEKDTRRLIRSMCDVHINLDENIEEYFCYCNNYKFSTAVCIICFFSRTASLTSLF
jgi:hypothetical protein